MDIGTAYRLEIGYNLSEIADDRPQTADWKCVAVFGQPSAVKWL